MTAPILVQTGSGPAQLAFLKTSATQALDGTSGSAATTAFSSETAVLIAAPEAFHMEIGTNPTATTSSSYFPPGLYETGIHTNYKIAIIKSSASTNGYVWVTPYGGKDF